MPRSFRLVSPTAASWGKLLVLTALFAAVSADRRTRAEAPAEAEARLLKDLKFLTSDACEGRGISTKGIDLAAEYLERQFVNAGLKPGGPSGSYYQPFTLATGAKLGPGNRLLLNGPLGQTLTLEHGKHFGTAPLGGGGKAEAALVFAGYGITSTDPKYDDYAGLNVAGKVVIVLADTPRRGHRYADLFAADTGTSPHLSLRAKIENARRHKAAALLVVNPRGRTPRSQDTLPRPTMGTTEGAPLGLPVAHVKREVVDRMLVSTSGETLAEIEQAIDADLKPRSLPLAGWSCQLETEVAYTHLKVKNVIGVLEGNGPLAKETVVIGAHYDHVGMAGTTRRIGGSTVGVSGPGSVGGVGFPLALMQDSAIHHGADDNASGTSVLLELARHFGAQKERQGRRLVFIAFTAEESGLLGSDYYCRHPTFPLADTVAMINMDQVGRLQDDKLLVGGLGSAKRFPPLVEKLNDKHRFALVKDLAGPAPSDQASFYARKVPVLWFFTGFHEQYHRPTDRVETLNVPGLRRITALIADVTADLATTSVRPEFVKAPAFDRTRTVWATAPSTGIVPDYTDAKGGVLVADVFRNTTAAKAGVRKGDRIVVLAGQKVPDPTAFLALTRALKPGETVELTVEREGKPQKVELVLARAPGGYPDPHFGFVADLTDVKDGLLLIEVLENGTAAKAGLRKGDRVVSLAGEAISDRDSYLTIIRALQPGETVAVTVVRDGKPQQFQVPTAKDRRPPE